LLANLSKNNKKEKIIGGNTMKKTIFLVAMLLAATVFADENQLASFWQAPAMDLEQAEKLAKFDLVVIDLENWFNNSKLINHIRQQNPDGIVLAYVNPMEFFDPPVPGRPFQQSLYQVVANQYPDWWLDQPNGEPIYYWNSPRMRMLNLSSVCPKYRGQSWTDFLASELKTKLLSLPNKPDGIFVDNAWDDVSWVKDGNLDADNNGLRDDFHALDMWWRQGTGSFLEKIKATGTVVIGNEPNLCYQDILAGKMFENVPANLGSMETMILIYTQDLGQLPLNIIHTEPKGEQWRMFLLATTLLGDGWFCHGINQANWYPEYDLVRQLGKPIGSVQPPHQLLWQTDEMDFATAKEVKSALLETGEYLVSYNYQMTPGSRLIVEAISEQYGGVFPYTQQIHDRWLTGNVYRTVTLTAPGRIVAHGASVGTAQDLRIWRKKSGPWVRQYENGKVLVWPDQARGEILLH